MTDERRPGSQARARRGATPSPVRGAARAPGTPAVGGKAGRSRTSAPTATARRKRKSPLWAKLLVTFGSVILVVAVVGGIGVNVLLSQVTKAIPTANLLGDQGSPAGAAGSAPSGSSIKGGINMLLIGLDTRIANPAMGSRSDSIIIAHIPPAHDQVYLVSIPRDTWVDIPGHGFGKINGAFQLGSQNGGGNAGGTKLLAATIKSLWGITFQGAAIVQFDGFENIVNQLGGVTMYVDETTTSIHHGVNIATGKPEAPYKINPNSGVPECPRGYSFTRDPEKCTLPGVHAVQYLKGLQHLTAYQALDYVRCRDGLPYTDYDRQRHQQQFIKALLEEAYQKGMSDPTKLSSFLKSIAQAFVFDPGSATTGDWIFTLKGINPSSIVSIKTNAGKYYSASVSGTSAEGISPDSLKLLDAIKNDTVADFLATHQDWISASG